MNALDQAFIKAYGGRGENGAATGAASAQTQPVKSPPPHQVPEGSPSVGKQAAGDRQSSERIPASEQVTGIAKTVCAGKRIGDFKPSPPSPDVGNKSHVDNHSPTAAAPAPSTILRLLRPKRQCERLAWPQLCLQLEAAASDQLDLLADAVLASKACGQKVVAFVGSGRGAGTTTVTLCAARRLGRRGLRTVLCDADTQQPGLDTVLSLGATAGWEAALSGDIPLADALIEAVDDRVTVLPLLRPTAPKEPGKNTGTVAETLQTLAQNYQIVLLDAGALDTASATSWLLAAIAGHVDAAILVSNSADGEKYLSAAARQSLANWGMDLVGVVTNFVSRHN